jgi:hypothetical protein
MAGKKLEFGMRETTSENTVSNETRRARALRALIGIVLASFAGITVPPAAADTRACLNATGYAFYADSFTAVFADNQAIFPFPSLDDGSFCDPPHTGDFAIGGETGTGVLLYTAGTGMSVATGAIASPSISGQSQGRISSSLFFGFTVVPDNPQSASPVPIEIVARHSFGRVRVDVSGFGAAGNGHVGYYAVHFGSDSGPVIGQTWSSEGVVTAAENESYDLHFEIDVPVNQYLVLATSLQQNSLASGSVGSRAGSGSAEISSTVTFEVQTTAAASIVFDIESGLGLPPPMLGVVTVPEPGAGSSGAWVPLVALATLASLKRRHCNAAQPALLTRTPRTDPGRSGTSNQREACE